MKFGGSLLKFWCMPNCCDTINYNLECACNRNDNFGKLQYLRDHYTCCGFRNFPLWKGLFKKLCACDFDRQKLFLEWLWSISLKGHQSLVSLMKFECIPNNIVTSRKMTTKEVTVTTGNFMNLQYLLDHYTCCGFWDYFRNFPL